jgi:hypothetical protein
MFNLLSIHLYVLDLTLRDVHSPSLKEREEGNFRPLVHALGGTL